MDRLAELRERRALTLRDLSEMSSVAADTINQIELGHRKPRPSTLRKLARALEVDVEEFYREPALPLAEAPDTGPSSVVDLALEAVRKQDVANWQAIARADESAREQLSTVEHENAAFLQLLERSQGELAEGIASLARRYVWDTTRLRDENAALRDQLQEREQAHS
jgi:transcriptional regulator with XRE-family HTH domain